MNEKDSENTDESTTQSNNDGSAETDPYDSQSIYDREFKAVDLLDDKRGLLSKEDEEAIEERLQTYAKEKRVDIAILITKKMDDSYGSLDQYINGHEFGKLKDGKRGYILLVIPQNKNLVTRCTSDLEQIWTDDEYQAVMNGLLEKYNNDALYDGLIDFIVKTEKYLDRYLEG